MRFRNLFGHNHDDSIKAEQLHETVCKEFEEDIIEIFPNKFKTEWPSKNGSITLNFSTTDSSAEK
jgi:hypothetical protein